MSTKFFWICFRCCIKKFSSKYHYEILLFQILNNFLYFLKQICNFIFVFVKSITLNHFRLFIIFFNSSFIFKMNFFCDALLFKIFFIWSLYWLIRFSSFKKLIVIFKRQSLCQLQRYNFPHCQFEFSLSNLNK